MPATSLPGIIATAPAYRHPDPILLWSTNTFIKFCIQQVFLGGKHYVWCSPEFDASKAGRYSLSSLQPDTSDPATIYRDLRRAISRPDGHNTKVEQQKATLNGLAIQLEANGTITADDKDEIIAMLKEATTLDFRPLIYTIPYASVIGRAQLVPRAKRASHAPEYIIEDLMDGEFRVIEPEAV